MFRCNVSEYLPLIKQNNNVWGAVFWFNLSENGKINLPTVRAGLPIKEHNVNYFVVILNINE